VAAENLTRSVRPTPSQVERVDEACDRFEAAWKAGQRPRIEDHMARHAGPSRRALLRELLALELELRRRGGERPCRREYDGRFPGDTGVIDAVFGGVAPTAEDPGLPGGRPVGERGPGADRRADLVLGLLAYQNGFVSRAALNAALAEWAADKSVPLGRVLAARGALGAEPLGLLEALTRQHIRAHGGDPARSLADLCDLGPLRDDLARFADTDAQIATSLAGSGCVGAGEPRSVGLVPRGGGPRFRIVRPHARGGLGEVFVARDEELNREVALKQIRPSHAHRPESRQRFVMEAEVTGGLEHPGVVPVYGLGYHGDGRPYYAMRFVKGDSLQDAVEKFHAAEGPGRDPGERSLALRGLLRRFVDVCNAVAYAHSRGVLHRDLKPGNVMLGPYGETLVVDWGLAKVIDRPDRGEDGRAGELLRPLSGIGSALTVQGQVFGTPSYMSPEQAAGRLDELGPGTDVYSLGAVLYYLTTGAPPVEGADITEVLRKVRAGDFPRPRAVNPSVPPALEAVCLKAMAARPADRYPSPRALADDVENWLGDEPVSAWREPLAVRLRRRVRRHRTLVAAAAGLAVAATVALAVGTALLGNANARTERRRREAEANLTRAEANYALARGAVDRYLTKVAAERLLDEPHMERLRRELLDTAREFYQKLVDAQESDPRAAADLGRAYERLSRISAELGEWREAIGQADRGRAVFEALAARDPADPVTREGLAGSLASLGAHLREFGQSARAEWSFRRAIGIWGGLAGGFPRVARYRLELARAHDELGTALQKAGRSAGALKEIRKALAIREQLVADRPNDVMCRRGLADGLTNLGLFHAKATGREAEAETALRRALEVRARLASKHPETADLRRDLAAAHINLGNLARGKGKVDQAEAEFRRALTIDEALAAANPGAVRYQRGVGFDRANLANVLRQAGRFAEAEAEFRRGLEVREKLAAWHPDVAPYQTELAVILNGLGNLYTDLGRFHEAEAALMRSTGLREKLSAAHPAELEFALSVGEAHVNFAKMLDAKGDHRAALGWLDRAEGVVAEAQKRGPRHTAMRKLRLSIHQSRGHVFDSLSWYADSLREWDRAIELSDAPQRDRLRVARALTAARMGDYRRAVAEVDAFPETAADPSGPGGYETACVLALASSAARGDAALADRLAERAVARLRRAAEGGAFREPGGLKRLDSNAGLNALRSRDDFQAFRLDAPFPSDPFAALR
jgi:serine/threonine-protein kinase